MHKIELGRICDFPTLPAEIEIAHHPYFLVKTGEAYTLISRICPHAGYTVESYDDQFVCTLHYWCFDRNTGDCLNVSGEKLKTYPVALTDDLLTAVLDS